MHQVLSCSSYPHVNLEGEITTRPAVLYLSNELMGKNKGTDVEEL